MDKCTHCGNTELLYDCCTAFYRVTVCGNCGYDDLEDQARVSLERFRDELNNPSLEAYFINNVFMGRYNYFTTKDNFNSKEWFENRVKQFCEELRNLGK